VQRSSGLLPRVMICGLVRRVINVRIAESCSDLWVVALCSNVCIVVSITEVWDVALEVIFRLLRRVAIFVLLRRVVIFGFLNRVVISEFLDRVIVFRFATSCNGISGCLSRVVASFSSLVRLCVAQWSYELLCSVMTFRVVTS
jgi:hypothetical protein